MANEFAVHRLNERGLAAAEDLAKAFDTVLAAVRAAAQPSGPTTPGTNGRELALVVTKLQEASFWAKRAMALNPENQQ